MSSGSLSRRYAKALMALGLEDGSYQRIGQDVASLANAIKASGELSSLLTNPVFPRDEREKIVLAILQRTGASKTVINFSKLLLDRERLNIVPDISRELSAMIDEKSGQIVAQVTSAVALNSVQQNELKTTLEGISGKKVLLETKEDPTLLGGLIAKVGDLVYDGSIRTQLQELGRTLGD
jgi:F-type H+-transporting ATPase subunit delta|tara:strand:- start:385 stop:924 length:540 start_codon:yes stop_codon:yes gene_type:complete